MTSALRWLPGVAVISLLAAALVVLMTQRSREFITEFGQEASRLAEVEARLTSNLSNARSDTDRMARLAPENIWRAGPGGSVEVQIQQALVEMARRSGLTLMSFGIGVPIDDVHQATLTEDLELSGTHESVARFLADLERQQPALAVSYMWLRQLPVDQTMPGSPVSLRITVWGFVAEEMPSP